MIKRLAVYASIIAVVAWGYGCTDAPSTSAPPEPAATTQAPADTDDLAALRRDIEIVFSKPIYSFTLAEAARGISIEYQIVVHRDVPGIVSLPQDAGHAILPGPSGLIPFEKLSGNGQGYCLGDVGLGDLPSTTPTTIRRGSYPRAFTWDGHNWTGPSDYDHPKGPPFPIGQYVLRVSCIGQQVLENVKSDFTLESSVPIRLTE